MTTIEQIRDNLLLKGLGKPVALNAVDWKVKQQNPSASDSEVQRETLEVIRTLVDDGLFQLGELDKRRFVSSKRSLNRSMHKLSRRYVKHYDDPQGWMYAAWMKLTPKGEQVALSLEEQGVDFYRDRCEISAEVPVHDIAEFRSLRAQVAEWRQGGDLLGTAVA